MSSFDRQARVELLALFPELMSLAQAPRQVVRPIPKPREVPFVLASRLAERLRG